MANIRTARRSGRVFRGGGMRRESIWIDVVGTITATVAASTAVLLNISSAGLLALRPFTVIRSRGYIYVQSDQNAAQELVACAIGHAVVSEQASAIGITAVPTPVTDKGSDLWFMYQTIMDFGGTGSAAAATGSAGVGLEYDSRAMRKVEDGDDVITVFESEIAGLTLGLTFRHTGRCLIKLH